MYACCRSIDDAVDQVAARGETVRPEVAGEMLVRAFESGGDQSGEEWMPAFRDTVSRKKIRRMWFEDLAIGVAGDAGPVNLQTWEELDRYCYRVAGTVGLMMMRVFGSEDPQAEPRALDLGRGMQLTNILRDVAEDARARRIYLPEREREKYGYGQKIFLWAGSRGIGPNSCSFKFHERGSSIDWLSLVLLCCRKAGLKCQFGL